MSNILHLSHSSFLVAYVDISFIKFCQWSVEGSWFFFFFSVFVCFPIYPCPAIQLYHINFMTLSTPTYTKKMLERKSSTNQAGHKPPFSSGLNMKKNHITIAKQPSECTPQCYRKIYLWWILLCVSYRIAPRLLDQSRIDRRPGDPTRSLVIRAAVTFSWGVALDTTGRSKNSTEYFHRYWN